MFEKSSKKVKHRKEISYFLQWNRDEFQVLEAWWFKKVQKRNWENNIWGVRKLDKEWNY